MKPEMHPGIIEMNIIIEKLNKIDLMFILKIISNSKNKS